MRWGVLGDVVHRREHAVEIIEHVVVPEAKNTAAETRELGGAALRLHAIDLTQGSGWTLVPRARRQFAHGRYRSTGPNRLDGVARRGESEGAVAPTHDAGRGAG